MNHKKMLYLTALVAAFALCLLPCGGMADLIPYVPGEVIPSYLIYQQSWEHAQTGAMTVLSTDHLTHTAQDAQLVEDYEGREGTALLCGEEGRDEWRFTIEKAGLYQIEVDYYPLKGHGGNIEKTLYLDGKIPFTEAESMVFQRRWQSAGPIVENNKGNDVQPGQKEVFGWYTQLLQDYQGYYNDPFCFYLSAGEHTLGFESVKNNLIIGEIRFLPVKETLSYAEYRAQHAEAAIIEHADMMLQAEEAALRSASSLSPAVERSSAATIPNAPDKHKLNVISGVNWNMPGQWISWKITVPETGLYTIALRWKQDTISGFSSSRKLFIDDEIPFAEAAKLKFPYTSNWQVTVLGDEEGDAYLFYLEEGEHELRLEATPGGMASIIARVQQSLTALNEDYRSIVQLTGVNPDYERDYELELYVPQALEDLAVQQSVLEGLMEELIAYNGEAGQTISSLQRVVTQIDKMLRRIDRIPRRMTSFKSDLGSLGDWIVDAIGQPLTLDYAVLLGEEDALPRANTNIFESLWYNAAMFFASFSDDNTYTGAADEEGNPTIVVWIGSGSLAGRDQAQVLRTMIDNYFTPQTGINVELQLVSAGSLLPATFAEKGPDVALQMGTSDIVNYGLRSAVADLSEFEDFEAVAARFMPQTIEPYSFGGAVYGIPETQTFPMLFYRTDILESVLGYQLGDNLTWDDIIALLPKILQKNMTIWLPPTPTMYYVFLRQYQGDFYRSDSLYTALDTPQAYRAFKVFTDFFTSYRLDKTMDFLSRFRTGEACLGIADYTMANTLAVSAPEIRGLWEMVPIPGVELEDGSVDHTGYLGSMGCIMMENSLYKDEAWAFMKWWTDAEAQMEFASQIEAILGAAGRYTTANLEAFQALAWSNKELESLMAQMEVSKARREMPGGYYTERQINFAIRSVIIDENNARDSLLDYAAIIDEEISSKAAELGLDMNQSYLD